MTPASLQTNVSGLLRLKTGTVRIPGEFLATGGRIPEIMESYGLLNFFLNKIPFF